MIVYPPTLPCPNTYDFTSPKTFARSEFDFAIRQTPVSCKVSQVTYGFVFDDSAQVEIFRQWYYDTTYGGAYPFQATWMVEGNENEKMFRFANVYKMNVKNGLFYMTATFDILTKMKDFLP